MPRRQDSIHASSLSTLFMKHPYLALFQKENWGIYLQLLAEIYDLIEDTGQQIPYEGVRMLALRFFRDREFQSAEVKVGYFITMCIEDLKVLKDFHDPNGQRMIETTRSGKQLLHMVEDLLSQRVKYSGTGAETLLGALNEALTSPRIYDQEAAIAHHREKIKAYRYDLKRIEKHGPGHATLLPVPHSVEALFSQAEDAAGSILAAVEDVKAAIEYERKQLAKGYMESTRSSGQSVNTLAEFYEKLHEETTYRSYMQAKNIFSLLAGHGGQRFAHKDVPRILQQLEREERLSKDVIKRSQLNGFHKQFEMADTAIQEKTRAQLQLLQLQVRYSLATNVRGLQDSLKGLLQGMLKHKNRAVDFLENHGPSVVERDLIHSSIQPFDFSHPPEIDEALVEETFEEDETRQLINALLRAEETTIKQIVERFRDQLKQQKVLHLANHRFQYGLVEYYVLSEIELFSEDIEKTETEAFDLRIDLKKNAVVLRNVPCYQYQMRSPDGFYANQ
jgi:hypothetical protein